MSSCHVSEPVEVLQRADEHKIFSLSSFKERSIKTTCDIRQSFPAEAALKKGVKRQVVKCSGHEFTDLTSSSGSIPHTSCVTFLRFRFLPVKGRVVLPTSGVVMGITPDDALWGAMCPAHSKLRESSGY